MEKIDNPCKRDMIVELGKIKPFNNKCKVTGQLEECNIEVTYVPDKYVLELGSYREFFKEGFNMYIEEMCEHVYNHLTNLLEPKTLHVKIFLTEETLTPWSVEMIL